LGANVLQIPADALAEGCERAHDLFMLNRLRDPEAAAESFDSVFSALGIDSDMRQRLHDALVELIPVKGDPVFEASTVLSMMAGVLVGLLIADSATPADELELPVVTE
jgi:hypothetical protein